MVVRQDRVEGFRKALERAELVYEPSLTVESMPSKEGGFEAMTRLLAQGERPAAAVCFDDVVAIGAMMALARHGLAVGRDMAIVGFDDTAEARHAPTALTTISVNAVGLGERAAQMLLRQIVEGEPRIETYIGEARLVVRESCGASSHSRRAS